MIKQGSFLFLGAGGLALKGGSLCELVEPRVFQANGGDQLAPSGKTGPPPQKINKGEKPTKRSRGGSLWFLFKPSRASRHSTPTRFQDPAPGQRILWPLWRCQGHGPGPITPTHWNLTRWVLGHFPLKGSLGKRRPKPRRNHTQGGVFPLLWL